GNRSRRTVPMGLPPDRVTMASAYLPVAALVGGSWATSMEVNGPRNANTHTGCVAPGSPGRSRWRAVGFVGDGGTVLVAAEREEELNSAAAVERAMSRT